MQCMIMANAHRGKNRRAFETKDFMIRDDEQQKQDETQRVIDTLFAVAKPKKAD